MRMRSGAALLGLSLAVGACGEFDAPNQNFSALTELTAGTPSKVTVATAAQGLLGTVTATNAGIRGFGGTVAQTWGFYGREGYNLDVSNPQNIGTIYSSTGGNAFQNLTLWVGPYATMKQANIVIAAADVTSGATAAEKEGLKGFAKTIKAIALFTVIRQTDVNGAALDALANPTDAPPAIATKAAVYTEILKYLDEGAAHLAAGGASFFFTMTPGFSSFNTPATFRQLNKGIRAKVNLAQVHPSNTPAQNQAFFTAALADLGASFISTSASMNLGAFHSYSTNAGDATNGLYDPTARQRYAHPSYATEAQLAAVGGALDRRFTSKIRAIPPLTRYFFPIEWTFQRYNSLADPIPLMRNEEVLLLRAEANIGLGTNSAAIADINIVRAAAGLPNISDPYVANVALKQPATLFDALMYEKKFSLMWETGDRWIDARKYGLLAKLPLSSVLPERAADVVWPYLMIPINECLPRAVKPAGCTTKPTPVIPAP